MRPVFVGFSGPIGYAYWRGGDRGNWASPNAVLKDVTGLLLCYDRLIFLSKDFCPEDMWDLPYVTFLAEDSSMHTRCQTAIEQYEEIVKANGNPGYGDISGQFTRIIATMTGTDRGVGIDNHSLALKHADFNRIGNSADAGAAVIDVGIVTALDLPDKIDVLTNSIATTVLDQKLAKAPNGYSEWHVDVAQSLGCIRVGNRLGSHGSYDESIEEVRNLPGVRAFRQYLADLPEGGAPVEAARDIQQIADDYARRTFMESALPRPWYTTVGRAGLGLLSTLPFGWIVTGGQLAHQEMTEWSFRRRSSWAAFVISLRDGPSVV